MFLVVEGVSAPEADSGARLPPLWQRCRRQRSGGAGTQAWPGARAPGPGGSDCAPPWNPPVYARDSRTLPRGEVSPVKHASGYPLTDARPTTRGRGARRPGRGTVPPAQAGVTARPPGTRQCTPGIHGPSRAESVPPRPRKRLTPPTGAPFTPVRTPSHTRARYRPDLRCLPGISSGSRLETLFGHSSQARTCHLNHRKWVVSEIRVSVSIAPFSITSDRLLRFTRFKVGSTPFQRHYRGVFTVFCGGGEGVADEVLSALGERRRAANLSICNVSTYSFSHLIQLTDRLRVCVVRVSSSHGVLSSAASRDFEM